MAKASIPTNETTKARIDALKNENETYNDVLERLLFVSELRQDIKGSLLIELTLKNMLLIGHGRKITQSELQRVTSGNLGSVKAIIELYVSEIEKHNSMYE